MCLFLYKGDEVCLQWAILNPTTFALQAQTSEKWPSRYNTNARYKFKIHDINTGLNKYKADIYRNGLSQCAQLHLLINKLDKLISCTRDYIKLKLLCPFRFYCAEKDLAIRKPVQKP